MPIITWRNVPGPELGSALAGIRSSADLFDRGAQAAQDAVQNITNTDAAVEAIKQAAVERQLAQAAFGAQDSASYDKLLAGGLTQGNLPGGTRLDSSLISPEMLKALDARGQDLYHRGIEQKDNSPQAIADLVRGVKDAQNPDRGYGQDALGSGDYGSLKAAALVSQTIRNARVNPTPDSGGSGSKAFDEQISAEGFKNAEAMRAKGTNEDAQVRLYRSLSGNPAVQAATLQWVDKLMPGLSQRILNPYYDPSQQDGSGAGPVGRGGGSGSGRPASAGTAGAGAVDAALGRGGISSSIGSPDTSEQDAAVRRYGPTLQDVQTLFGDKAPPPPGSDWSGHSTGTPTFGESFDWNDQYGLPATKAQARGGYGADGKPLGTTATGLYQITNDTLKEFAPVALGDKWRDAPMTPENQYKVAEAIFKARGTKPWKSLEKFDPSIFIGKSFAQVAPMIKALESGLPSNYSNDVSYLQQDLISKLPPQDDSTKIAFNARQHPMDGVDQAVLSVSDFLKKSGTKTVNPQEIKKYLTEVIDPLSSDYKVPLSQAEKAGLLIASLTNDTAGTVEDVGSGWTVDKGRLESLIKDFGHAQGNAAKIDESSQYLNNLKNLQDRYTQATQDLQQALDFAKRSPDPDAQAVLPSKFAAVERASNRIKDALAKAPGKAAASAGPSAQDVASGIKQSVASQPQSSLSPEEIKRQAALPENTDLLAPQTATERDRARGYREVMRSASAKLAALEQDPALTNSPAGERLASDLRSQYQNAKILGLFYDITDPVVRLFRPNEDPAVKKARDAAALDKVNADIAHRQEQQKLFKEMFNAPPPSPTRSMSDENPLPSVLSSVPPPSDYYSTTAPTLAPLLSAPTPISSSVAASRVEQAIQRAQNTGAAVGLRTGLRPVRPDLPVAQAPVQRQQMTQAAPQDYRNLGAGNVPADPMERFYQEHPGARPLASGEQDPAVADFLAKYPGAAPDNLPMRSQINAIRKQQLLDEIKRAAKGSRKKRHH